jgi:hypothetical protein
MAMHFSNYLQKFSDPNLEKCTLQQELGDNTGQPMTDQEFCGKNL